MLVLIIAVLFFGFYCCYNTSRRAVILRNYPIEKWLAANSQTANIMGLSFLFAGFFLSVIELGWGGGAFSFLVMLMSIASLIVLLAPIKFFSFRALVILMVLAFLIELFIR